MTKEEMKKLGWAQADVILVCGDAYIDSPFSGVAVIGKWLLQAGFKVCVISQPSLDSGEDILRLGKPLLYWGVSAGATDSLVANYTGAGKKRRSCDFTPGGINDKRPDRATIAYTNLIKRFDKGGAPVVLGGIEASLRRLAHYDLLTDSVRRSIIFDSKADYLIYGMGERPSVDLAYALKNGSNTLNIKSLVYVSKDFPENATILPSYEEVKENKEKFADFFKDFYEASGGMVDKVLVQKTGDRYAVQNPPYIYSSEELDDISAVPYEREVHPHDLAKGEVKAADTIRFSVSAHRGCFGECNFCAISVHQGRRVVSRSEDSVLNEIRQITKLKKFKGIISDIGGPTANMYGSECSQMKKGKVCMGKRCLYPSVCPSLSESHKRYNNLLKRARSIEGVKKVFVASGIRCDMTTADKRYGGEFIRLLAEHHTSGQIKLAPEHIDLFVLKTMGKSAIDSVEMFAEQFLKYSKDLGKKQFVTYYFMAAHPGCTLKSMESLKSYVKNKLGIAPEQVQIFTPTPSTWSTTFFHTGFMYNNKNETVFSEKSVKEKVRQKEILVEKNEYSKKHFNKSHKSKKHTW